MDDIKIIELYWNRNENAVKETQKKYHFLLMKIAYAVLGIKPDSEEVVNDTYLRTWNSIPDDKPERFSAYLAKITRRLAIDYLRKNKASKRGSGEYIISLSELNECVADFSNAENEAEAKELANAVNSFLEEQSERNRNIFLQRYFYFLSIAEIADNNSVSRANVKTVLCRMRNDLKNYLISEGYLYG